MRDKTFEGTWSTHRVFNDRPKVEITRDYDSFTEKGKCNWIRDEYFIHPNEIPYYRQHSPYLSKSNSIVFPHGMGSTINSVLFYGETYKVRLDNAGPLNIPNKGTRGPSKTTAMRMKEWSQHKRIRIRTGSTSRNDLDINTNNLLEAIKSMKKCKSLNNN